MSIYFLQHALIGMALLGVSETKVTVYIYKTLTIHCCLSACAYAVGQPDRSRGSFPWPCGALQEARGVFSNTESAQQQRALQQSPPVVQR